MHAGGEEKTLTRCDATYLQILMHIDKDESESIAKIQINTFQIRTDTNMGTNITHNTFTS